MCQSKSEAHKQLTFYFQVRKYFCGHLHSSLISMVYIIHLFYSSLVGETNTLAYCAGTVLTVILVFESKNEVSLSRAQWSPVLGSLWTLLPNYPEDLTRQKHSSLLCQHVTDSYFSICK